MDQSIGKVSLFNEWVGADIRVKHEHSGLTLYLNSAALPDLLTQEYLASTIGKCKLPPEMLLTFFHWFSFIPAIGPKMVYGLSSVYHFRMVASIIGCEHLFPFSPVDPEIFSRYKFDIKAIFKQFCDLSKQFTNATLQRIILDICMRFPKCVENESELKTFVLEDAPALLPIYGGEFYARCMFLAGGCATAKQPLDWLFDITSQNGNDTSTTTIKKDETSVVSNSKEEIMSLQPFGSITCLNYCLNYCCNRFSSPTNVLELKFANASNFEIIVSDGDVDYVYKIHDWIFYNRWEWFKDVIDSGMMESQLRRIHIEMPNFVFKMLLTYVYLTGDLCGLSYRQSVFHDFEIGERGRCHKFVEENGVYYKIFDSVLNADKTKKTLVARPGWEQFDRFWVAHYRFIKSGMNPPKEYTDSRRPNGIAPPYFFSYDIAFCHK